MRNFKSYIILIPWWSLKKIYKIIIVASIGAFFVGILAFFLYMSSLPSLSLWHTTILKNEFTAKSEISNISEYFALEEKLFEELDVEIYDKIAQQKQNNINRYTNDSLSNPKRWKKNWNKSFELTHKNAKGAALLIHGMSDSPYSLRSQAQYLHENGYWVLGLRMPGHGTIPSGLRNVKWQDAAAVVELGMKHLSNVVKDKPIHMMGYSTGAPLALHYTLNALESESTQRLPSSLIFYSPAIGVSKAAPLAVWQSRIGYLLGLPKLEWNALLPEFDPYKYGSFAVNAGDQVYRLSKEVQEQFDAFKKHPSKKAFPPILSFSSILDSTVSVPAVVNKLFNRLPKAKHSLVLFDINHNFSRNHLVKASVLNNIKALRNTPIHKNYTFDLITNQQTKNNTLEKITNQTDTTSLKYKWPHGLYSLSHLAIPISLNDPLYGSKDAPKSPGISLGHLAIYGETGALQSSPASLLRQRWNPFHEYTKQRVLKFLVDK